ncbi:MAG: hypothetical protein AAGA30_01975 [Planctomycetota bacterium]
MNSEENIVSDDLVLSDDQRQDLENRSEPFLGKWSKLISTTNWEKGKIVVDWQASMAKSELPKSSYSDERWSQLVGGATPQHIGRLRRTFERYGHVYKEYEGLYWSHFFAALDWDDAEMWLEGAVQNSWSVSKMRNSRWETMGQRPEDRPQVEQIVVSELDEENQSMLDAANVSDRDREIIEGPIPEGPDFGDEETGGGSSKSNDVSHEELESSVAESTGPKIRPFESFTDLPEDVSKAANSFKIAIIKHKAAEWDEISVDQLHGLLDALKALATAAS